MPRRSYPQLLKHEFTHYTADKFRQDLLAGLTVAAVALLLALAFGVAVAAHPPGPRPRRSGSIARRAG